MSVKLFVRVEWNETFRTRCDPFSPNKFLNFGLEILVEWIAPKKTLERERQINILYIVVQLLIKNLLLPIYMHISLSVV